MKGKTSLFGIALALYFTSLAPVEKTAFRTIQSLPSARECPAGQGARDVYQAAFAGGSRTRVQTVASLELSGNSEELEIASRILDGRLPSQASSSIGYTCQRDRRGAFEVKCALTAAFGSEETALYGLALAQRTGYVLSLSQDHNAPGRDAVWNSAQALTLYKTLSLLPAEAYPEGVKRVVLFHPNTPLPCGSDPNHHACNYWGPPNRTSNEARDLQFKDYANPSPVTPEIILHLLGHDYDSVHYDMKPGRKGFDKAMSKAIKRGATAITAYAAQNDLENFAESFRFYVLKPEELRSKLPELYQYFKDKVFKGREFIEAKPRSDFRGLFRSCFSGIHAFRPSVGDFWIHEEKQVPANEVVRIKDSNGWHEYVRRGTRIDRYDLYIRPSTDQSRYAQYDELIDRCIQPAVETAATEASLSPDYCQRGGATVVRDNLIKRFNSGVSALFAAAQRNPFFDDATAKQKILACMDDPASSLHCKAILNALEQ